MENIGFEPITPCLQSKCSPVELIPLITIYGEYIFALKVALSFGCKIIISFTIYIRNRVIALIYRNEYLLNLNHPLLILTQAVLQLEYNEVYN